MCSNAPMILVLIKIFRALGFEVVSMSVTAYCRISAANPFLYFTLTGRGSFSSPFVAPGRAQDSGLIGRLGTL